MWVRFLVNIVWDKMTNWLKNIDIFSIHPKLEYEFRSIVRHLILSKSERSLSSFKLFFFAFS